jgi:tetratricopeptide (TPR) repeat protein
MWRWLKMHYKLIILSIAVGAMVIIIFNWYRQRQDLEKILELRQTIDFTGVESAVVTKLNQAWDEAEENSNSAEKWGKLGMNLYIHGYKIQSIPVFKKAASIDNEDFRWIYFCALALDDINSEETNDWYERGRQLNPNFPPLCVKLGNRYLISGELNKATGLFKAAMTSWKNVPHAYVGLAKIAIATNELDTAQVRLQEALDLAPKYRDAHVLLADVYRRKGDKSGAEAEFQMIERLPTKLDLKDPFFNQMVDEGVSSFWCQVRGDNYLNSGNLNMAVIEFKNLIEQLNNIKQP